MQARKNMAFHVHLRKCRRQGHKKVVNASQNRRRTSSPELQEYQQQTFKRTTRIEYKLHIT
jgi:hypothetical protein